MTENEVITFIEEMARSFSPNATGNEVNADIADRLRQYAIHERYALLGAVRKYLSFRVRWSQRQYEDAVSEARLWMALDVSVILGLKELVPEVCLLRDAVRDGRVLRLIDEEEVIQCLHDLQST